MLSKNEEKVLDYVRDYMERNGWAPTVREICKATNIRSTSSVHYILKRLEKKGFVVYQGVRQIRVVS